MPRSRLIPLNFVGLLTVVVMSSPSAVADPAIQEIAECTSDNPPATTLCISAASGKLYEQLVTGSWGFKGHKAAVTKSLLFVESGPDIHCAFATATGDIDTSAVETLSLNVANVVIVFETCSVENSLETHANCVVSVLIEVKAEGLMDVPEHGVTFKPIGGGVFTTITITSTKGKTCIFAKSKVNVTGEQLCELLPPEVEEDRLGHLLDCTEFGSSLLYAEKPAKFALEEELSFAAKNNAWSLTGS
jgi:hypothetical protein